ncbi:MAG: sigma-54-dependent Fis family transcriptional regulator [Gemmatimonadetes bacterium]|nr:sigma-54-dependent Fis family transcriptional regulator [Gemmatimonadota bacterium]MBT5143112.1 sigma-54-dependent Fis family transcriptional regulator [Gemmatimonadota bacterium]MBT5588377.1 sigma-54-dependent Fis family transcriptional regulator [Gemmatimonadota bacterium]MBT5963537.1 sigma-54-dependent Fis family transcriptional regulator [Gemmatimonadota bacterium]MBT7454076.1 sigma-54-dependent Fis family transcriptional regulator [Gemmatimonadota bacterium]
MTQILVVDDQEFPRQAVVDLIEHEFGITAATAASATEALATLAEQAFDLVITDLKMDEMDGIQLLERVRADHAGTEVIVVTGYGSIEDAVEAMRIGASDFVVKDGLSRVLPIKITKALENRSARHERDRLGEENRYLREEIGDRFGEIVGDSDVIRQVLATVSKVSATDSSVLIYGESGTGKELVARAIHRQSNRSEGPFVRVNCGALPRELVESELFGHEKGAFTGAVRQKKGRFELAQGGTIFLDEIADLPLDTQVNLLRVLQEKEFDRVGGEQTLTADVRVVAATNRKLKQMVADNEFREDLYYRLEVIPIQLPPLRQRRDDIPALVVHVLAKKCREINVPMRRLTEEAMQVLTQYPWPGNVRELENIIERTVVLVDSDTIGSNDLPLELVPDLDVDLVSDSGSADMAANADGGPMTQRLERLEKQMIEGAMQEAKGVKTQAAERLGIKTSALYYKLDKYGIDYSDDE